MADSMRQPRDENGHFVSLREFIERILAEREREVEQTARRLEKEVENARQAHRDVSTAHFNAHARDHEAHTNIHRVEKEHVDRAIDVIDKRLAGMNEFRQALQDQAGKVVSRELFDTLKEELQEVKTRMAYCSGAAAVLGAVAAILVRLVTT